MAVGTDHLALFVMDICSGAEFTHVLAGKTGAMAGVAGFIHGRGFLEPMSIKKTAFGNRRPGDMAGTATGVTVGTVELPGFRKQGVFHLVR